MGSRWNAMITPSFKLSQDENYVIVTIHAPFAKISDTEISFDEGEFLFSSKPYFLRLFLPGKVIENGKEKADFNVETNSFRVTCPKAVSGEHFVGLDMMTALLTPKGKPSAAKVVEEVEGVMVSDSYEKMSLALEKESECGDEWYWKQEVVSTVSDGTSAMVATELSSKGYGFACQRFGELQRLVEDAHLLFGIKNPDATSIEQRRAAAYAHESADFNDEHYLADKHDPDEIVGYVIEIRAPWDQEDPYDDDEPKPFSKEFSDQDRDRLKDLPGRTYTLSHDEVKCALLSLIDIIYAYAYDYRTTDGEHSVESGWTICKLSQTLSYLVRWQSAKEAAVSSIRRSLCYPLYRNWHLSIRVLNDVKKIVALDRISILKCLLAIHRILAVSGDYRYILNDLYITDYCVWIQHCSDEYLQWLQNIVSAVSVQKSDVELDLDAVELCGEMALLQTDPMVQDRTESIDSGTEMLNKVRCVAEDEIQQKHQIEQLMNKLSTHKSSSLDSDDSCSDKCE